VRTGGSPRQKLDEVGANTCSYLALDCQMMVVLQGSLLDSGSVVRPGALVGSVQRTLLGERAWVDLRPSWIAGADELFDRLWRSVPWQAERRRMYDRTVDVPRLLSFYKEGDALPDPALEWSKRVLSEHYQAELGEPFCTLGMCLYRDGQDSVAWHGDTNGRGGTQDTMVAIVSLGARRRLSLRPRAGGTALRFDLGRGDLFVMGGDCQRTWEHSVPKTKRPVGPRISLQFRPVGVS
jgi:alkylated DNA repair dioxygenase AlkB